MENLGQIAAPLMESLTGIVYILGIFAILILLLSFFVFIPLPLYITGKIFGIDRERFSYFSCIWTLIAIGIAAFACSFPFIMAIVIISEKLSPIDEDILSLTTNIIILIFALFWFFRFFKRHYGLGYGKITGVLIVTFIFDIIQSAIVGFILAMTIGFTVMTAFSGLAKNKQIQDLREPYFQDQIKTQIEENEIEEISPSSEIELTEKIKRY